MANGSNHDRLAQKCDDLERRIEERYSEIERRIEDRSNRRDAEATRSAEIISDLAARVDAAEKAVARIEGIRQPGLLALWGPAVATLVLVGSAGTFVLTERVSPIERVARDAAKDNRELSALYGDLARDHAAAEKALEWHRDWIESLQVDATKLDEKVDNLRVLVERKEK